MTTLAEKSQAGSRFTTSPLGRAHVVPRNRSAVAGIVLPRQENVLARTELAAATSWRFMDVSWLTSKNYKGCVRGRGLLRRRC